MQKICVICGETFEAKNPKRIFCSSECKRKNDYKKYGVAACKRWVKNNPERFKAILKKYELAHPGRRRILKQKYRLEALKYISDELKCSNPECLVPGGCTDIRALQIDHVNGGGSKEATELGKGYRDYQARYWKHILALPQEEARKRYQLLCANCNFIKLFEENEFAKR